MKAGLEYRKLTFLVKRIMGDPRFFLESGYKCPYCGFRGRQNTPLSAYHIALHVYKEHAEQIREEITVEIVEVEGHS